MNLVTIIRDHQNGSLKEDVSFEIYYKKGYIANNDGDISLIAGKLKIPDRININSNYLGNTLLREIQAEERERDIFEAGERSIKIKNYLFDEAQLVVTLGKRKFCLDRNKGYLRMTTSKNLSIEDMTAVV